MQKKIALLLVSFLGLFLELCLIRWFPAHIFSLAFFSNTVLMASFLGLGLGLFLSNNRHDLFVVFPFILAAAVSVVLFLRNVQVALPGNAQTWIWSYYEGNRLLSGPISWKITITQLIGLIFVLTVIIFMPVGQRIGKLMAGFSPLFGYTLNILGSLLGVIGFGIFSFFSSPAYSWFVVIGIILVYASYKENNFVINIFVMAAIILAIVFMEKDTLWSPYYSVKLRRSNENSISVYINQLFHQKAINFEQEPYAYQKYMLAYKWFRPERVLIIGSGTGNDVWIARQAGASHIDAVEIDPLILKLGFKGHPNQPYNSHKVMAFVDDARSFMQRAAGRYDMIVYGTLDSHASLSVTSSVRLDNYVYTQEALQASSRLLMPSGVIVLLFSVPKEWIGDRLLYTISSVFGSENTRYLYLDPYLFNLMIIAGPGLRKSLLANPDLSNIMLTVSDKPNPITLKDNWPYLYLEHRGIPRLYLTTLLLLVCLSVVAVFIFSPLKTAKIDPLFFLLGCGFLLLEAKSVTTFSLLFGSTWLVNAVVFSAILTVALLANLLVMTKRLEDPRWAVGGLLLSLLFLYFFPLATLLKYGFAARIFISGMLSALPIFFSSAIFAVIIRKTRDIAGALGSNLLGAVVGGFFEYSSMIWGLSVLYLIAFGCYAVAGFYLLRKKSLFRLS